MDIATAEEILATMEDDTSEYEDVCLIDTETRVISVSEKLKIVGVESDEDVVRRTFRMPWRFGENDLSTFTIRINYLNAHGEGDIYPVKDMAKSGDDMMFSWLLSRHATKYKGNIRFVVCMILPDRTGIDKEWNTTLAEFTVLEGLETSGQIEEDNPDVIESILLRLNTLESTGGVSDEQIENAVNAYLTEHPVEAGATAEQAAQIQKNKEDIEELQKNGVGGGITEEKDPTVPAWAKAEKKPSYTAEEVGALPSTYEPPVTSVNGKTGAVALVASDVGALPSTTVIPTVPNALKNPYPLTINGVEYDGSEAKTINIQASGGGESVSLDTTLTQYGMAADAGAVGNALEQEKQARNKAIDELREAIDDKLDASELPTAINTALTQAKESGQFNGAPGKDGKDGEPGAKGDPGDDYVLTEADKEEIAGMAAELVEVPEGGGSAMPTKLVWETLAEGTIPVDTAANAGVDTGLSFSVINKYAAYLVGYECTSKIDIGICFGKKLPYDQLRIASEKIKGWIVMRKVAEKSYIIDSSDRKGVKKLPSRSGNWTWQDDSATEGYSEIYTEDLPNPDEVNLWVMNQVVVTNEVSWIVQGLSEVFE